MVRSLNKSKTSLLIPIPAQTVKAPQNFLGTFQKSIYNILNLKILLTSQILAVKYHSNCFKNVC